jgi:hypothetical protein
MSTESLIVSPKDLQHPLAPKIDEGILDRLKYKGFVWRNPRAEGNTMLVGDGTVIVGCFDPEGKTLMFPATVVTSFGREFHEWLEQQVWYKQDNEYSVLFEKLFDLPSQRQAFIESEVEHARPYWGYLYLADMMDKNLFNICFTTNFDDLLNDAFSSFIADTKPIVCAHDSLVSQIRLTSKRPKILKLHGDFLYQSIKNTEAEISSLEKNMRAKFAQFAKEIGLIVVGYGGNDSSIMTILAKLLKDNSSFPFGIHWCLSQESSVNSKLRDLLPSGKVFIYKIEDFDNLMAAFYMAFKLELPKYASNPLQVMAKQLNTCLQAPGDFYLHPLIQEHAESLRRSLERGAERRQSRTKKKAKATSRVYQTECERDDNREEKGKPLTKDKNE